MAAELNPIPQRAVTEAARRSHRDLWPAPVKAPVDKNRVLAHLRGLLAELRALEANHADT